MNRFAIAAALGLGLVGPAFAAEYTLLVYEHPHELAKRTEESPVGQAYWAGYGAFAGELKSAGVLRGGAALRPNADARTLQIDGAKPVVSQRAYAESGAQLGGYFVIDVDSLEVALAWASKVPSAANGGAVEVRPVYPAPGMN